VLRKDGVVFAFRHLVADQPNLKNPKRMTCPVQDLRGHDLERSLVARDPAAQASKGTPQLHRTLKVKRWVYRENAIESISAAHGSARRPGELQQTANESLIRLARTLAEDGASVDLALRIEHLDYDCGIATNVLFERDVLPALTDFGSFAATPGIVDEKAAEELRVNPEREQWWRERAARCLELL
jgi:hypothetical protein